ncbi:class I SAM-dependent methyltransferase [Haloglomus litoreum]|uniref:class I SAM-dependent methyltransferase n=1 Tax=Haloglomus litoreum TaxID=3034026 RepID=UPI0023E77E9F|nr:class I SAM-dependent methyltransferase [Haloglomus sp. DT116]
MGDPEHGTAGDDATREGSTDDPVRFEVEAEFLTIGRTFEEYAAMFDLDVDRLAGDRVLDCPSGVGSFVTTARDRGLSAIGADILYDHPRGAIAETAREDCEATVDQLRGSRDLFTWDWYGDLDSRAEHLRRAHRTFLADYPDGPYLAAGLPDLPFPDDSFDLALSANLLFLYDDRLDGAFHAAALRELARVAGEVRVFPLASLDTERSKLVEPTIERLRADGIAVETRTVPYEFQPGATEMLVVGR